MYKHKMKRMKIAQVITRMDWGGSPDMVRLTCEKLLAMGQEVILITGPTKNQTQKTNEFINSFNAKVVVIRQLQRDVNLFNDLITFIKLYLIFREENFDVVHTHTAKAGALGRLAAYFAGVKVIVHTPHGHNFYGYFNRLYSKLIIFIEKFLTFFTTRIIALTELERSDYIKFKVAAKDKINLIYLGLELEPFLQQNFNRPQIKNSLGVTAGELTAAMIGRLETVKGPGFFVEAAKLVIKDFTQAKFFLVGEGSLRAKLEKRVEESGLKDSIIFTGWRNNVPEIISVLDVLVLPSLNEAVGIVLIEAQASGIPVVAADVGGTAEVVKDGISGLLVPAADPGSMAIAISSLFKDPVKRKEMGEAGRVWVKDRFSAQKMTEKIFNLYSELYAG
ncbi:MAG: glycosyltransferase family 4 protein [Candidatus Omnitrophica bacterium]|nr:glycosyltransferase family 4 protein [Candidatus Omnitrophota bacterium]